MSEGTITEGQILTGVMFNEPMRVITTRQSGTGTVIAGLVGQSSGQFREVTLTAEDIAQLNAIDPNASYDGDGGTPQTRSAGLHPGHRPRVRPLLRPLHLPCGPAAPPA